MSPNRAVTWTSSTSQQTRIIFDINSSVALDPQITFSAGKKLISQFTIAHTSGVLISFKPAVQFNLWPAAVQILPAHSWNVISLLQPVRLQSEIISWIRQWAGSSLIHGSQSITSRVTTSPSRSLVQPYATHLAAPRSSILGGVPGRQCQRHFLFWAERAQGPPLQRIGLLEIPEQAKSLNDCLQDCIDQSSRLIKGVCAYCLIGAQSAWYNILPVADRS